MLNHSAHDEQLRIRIHHIGGIGESGPVEVLGRLGHVEWVFYDAQAESLSSVRAPGNLYRLVQRAIGGADSSTKFYITAWPSASSLLRPSPDAEKYTMILGDGRAQVWGPHTKIVESVDMQVHTLDTLVGENQVPQIDFLSIDAQGAELSILEGASSSLKERIVGVLCEVEFTELYQNQPLFCDIQNRLRTDHFRLCEIFNSQYFNTAPISPQFRGRGFLTVGEALFLRDARTWLGDDRETEGVSSTQGTVQTLKLAAVAVAFDQLDYAIEICRHLENTSLVSLDTLARESNVKYISMLRDLCRAADSTHSNHHSYLEPPEKVLSSDRRSHARVMLRIVLELVRLTLLALASKFSRKILRKGFGRKYPPTSKILLDYGFEELAIKQAIRNAGIPYLTGGYYARYLDLIMLFLFRTL